MGSLAHAGLMGEIPEELLNRVGPGFRSPAGQWVGTSGRARTVVYNTSAIDPENDLPDLHPGLHGPRVEGRVGWAPLNASYQSFVTAFRLKWGEEAARRGWKASITRGPPIPEQHDYRGRRGPRRGGCGVCEPLLTCTGSWRKREKVSAPGITSWAAETLGHWYWWLGWG